MQGNTQDLKQLEKDLFKLQEHGAVVMADLRRSHRNLYLHLSELYFWWCDASQLVGYLDKQYAGLNRKFKTVTYGTNYSPLLILAYGNNSGLDRNSLDRYSRALNAIHKECKNRPDFYLKDKIAKLANFIEQSGGITKLAGYAPPEKDSISNNEPDKSHVGNEEAKKRKDLLKRIGILEEYGQKFFVPYSPYFKTTAENFSLLLVQRTDAGFNIIDTQNKPDVVDTVLADSLSKRFDVTVFSIRPLLELLQTQCLPAALESFVDKLVDTHKKMKLDRRVLFLPKTGEFILSPINANSGVVSTIRAYVDLILDNCNKDVFMPITERDALEKKLLRPFEFNLYDTELKTFPIQHYPKFNSASHVIHLRHRIIANEFLNISFWPFYNTILGSQDQVIINPDYPLIPTWYAHYDRSEIKRINDVFVENWLYSHGKYITRDPHGLLKVTFTKNSWTIEFVYKTGTFENAEHVHLIPIEAADEPFTVIFRFKDFVPVFISLADLPITESVKPQTINDLNNIETDEDESLGSGADVVLGHTLEHVIPEEAANYKGGVWLGLNKDVLCIKFCTEMSGGGEHTIYIPTVDEQGNLATAPFMRYDPEITLDPNPPTESDKQIIEDWPETVDIEP